MFSLSGSGMSSFAASGVMLRLNTPILNLTLNPVAIADIAGRGCREISIIVGTSGGSITVSILAEGQKLDAIGGNITALLSVPNADSSTVAATITANGTSDIIILSVAKAGMLMVPLVGSCVFAVISKTQSFSDVKDHWAEDFIDLVTARNLFQGTGGNQFRPDTGMTRGMVVAVLGRLGSGISGESANPSFSDIDENAFYAQYVEWAARNGIVRGNGDGQFLADQNVTREQLATILPNYIHYIGLTFTLHSIDIGSFEDDGEISDYARDGIKAILSGRIMNGKDGNRLDPKGTASRAEVAVMLERLVANIVW